MYYFTWNETKCCGCAPGLICCVFAIVLVHLASEFAYWSMFSFVTESVKTQGQNQLFLHSIYCKLKFPTDLQLTFLNNSITHHLFSNQFRLMRDQSVSQCTLEQTIKSILTNYWTSLLLFMCVSGQGVKCHIADWSTTANDVPLIINKGLNLQYFPPKSSFVIWLSLRCYTLIDATPYCVFHSLLYIHTVYPTARMTAYALYNHNGTRTQCFICAHNSHVITPIYAEHVWHQPWHISTHTVYWMYNPIRWCHCSCSLSPVY